MTDVTATNLRRLADLIDQGKAHILSFEVSNDVDIVDVNTTPYEHQKLDLLFRGQRLVIEANSMVPIIGTQG